MPEDSTSNADTVWEFVFVTNANSGLAVNCGGIFGVIPVLEQPPHASLWWN